MLHMVSVQTCRKYAHYGAMISESGVKYIIITNNRKCELYHLHSTDNEVN